MQDTEPDSGLAALAILLRYHAIVADLERIRHEVGRLFDNDDIIRAAKRLGLRCRQIRSRWDRLSQTSLPAIAVCRDGRFRVLAAAAPDRVLVQDPLAGRPQTASQSDFEAVWSGDLILLTRRVAAGAAGRFGLGWFLPAVLKYRRLLGEVLVASFFIQIFALLTPLFFQVVIDKVLVHRGLGTLDVLIIGLVAIGTFEALLGALRAYVFSHTASRIDVELGAKLFRHLLALPMAYYGARRVGDSVARVRELETIRSFITGSSLTLVLDLFFTVVFLAVMLCYSGWLTLIVVGAFPFYLALGLGITPVLRRRLDEKFARGAENQAFLVESVTGVETLKAMAVEPQMQRRWEEQLAGYVQSSFRAGNLNAIASQAAGWISKMTTALILYFGARLVIDGTITVGELVAFNMLASRVSAPVLRLAQLWQDFQQARLSVDRLADVLNAPPEPGAATTRGQLPPMRGGIRFEHVSFRYRSDTPEVLSDVNLAVAPGQVIGIVGPSGSGKSTLTRLVQRLHLPSGGRVLVDGIDLALADVGWLRRQIGVVLQENILFNRTVRENIALADPAMPIERVIAAAELAGAHDFIMELPYGYDTVIGERGTSLSGGQRQRIAIARALVLRPRILILDEATSALDYESERIVQQNMRRIVAGRTVLIIAHRLSAVRHADRILTVERGRIIEDGSHDELIRRGGRYAALHRAQSGLDRIG